MPIYLEWLEQPSEQDCLDLDKLYNDAPEQWSTHEGIPLNAQWALKRVTEQHKLALGRFNDRIVCAAWLALQTESSSHSYLYEIDKLCVRAITRERGVAKQLMVRLCQWAKNEGCHLYVRGEGSELSNLYELGFVRYLEGWRYSPL